MAKRATQRPAPFVRPGHWSTEPAPEPAAPDEPGEPEKLGPTRYGDWVKNGIAIDF